MKTDLTYINLDKHGLPLAKTSFPDDHRPENAKEDDSEAGFSDFNLDDLPV